MRFFSLIYDRCGLQRVGVVVAAYCEYTGLCPPNQQDQQSLDRFSMKRFLNERVCGLRTPSDKRYILQCSLVIISLPVAVVAAKDIKNSSWHCRWLVSFMSPCSLSLSLTFFQKSHDG